VAGWGPTSVPLAGPGAPLHLLLQRSKPAGTAAINNTPKSLLGTTRKISRGQCAPEEAGSLPVLHSSTVHGHYLHHHHCHSVGWSGGQPGRQRASFMSIAFLRQHGLAEQNRSLSNFISRNLPHRLPLPAGRCATPACIACHLPSAVLVVAMPSSHRGLAAVTCIRAGKQL